MSTTTFPATLPQRRKAFTLVELLVVIAIIGILVGLLLPAVQAAREAARRVSCMNNLTQVGLAVHHYEFSAETLPAGVISPQGPIRNEAIGQHVSWLVQILPFLEQQALYNNFDVEAGAYAPVNQQARRSSVPTLMCPSFPGPSRSGSSGMPRAGISNYAGCHNNSEAPIDSDNNGLLFLNSNVRYSEILDGSSQTILVGEIIASNDSLGWVSGTRATLRNTSEIDNPGRWPLESSVQTGSLDVGGFGSFHPGGALFTFADGSTRFLSKNINPELLKQFGHRADGELLEDE